MRSKEDFEMTFEQFQAESRKRQSAYITCEEHKLKAAWKLWRKYELAMHKLSLHALTPAELAARADELHRMRCDIPTKYADNEAMRASYAAFQYSDLRA